MQLKLRLADFTTFTRQRTLRAATDDGAEIGKIADEILRGECTGGRRFRLIGVGASNLQAEDAVVQLGLFDRPAAEPEAEGPSAEERARARAAALEATLAELRERFGGAVQFAADQDRAGRD